MVMPAGASPQGPASKSPLRLKSPQSYKLFFIPANIFRAASQLNKQACRQECQPTHPGPRLTRPALEAASRLRRPLTRHAVSTLFVAQMSSSNTA